MEQMHSEENGRPLRELEQACRELEAANAKLGGHWITEQDIVRRNRAERIVKESEGRNRET